MTRISQSNTMTARIHYQGVRINAQISTHLWQTHVKNSIELSKMTWTTFIPSTCLIDTVLYDQHQARQIVRDRAKLGRLSRSSTVFAVAHSKSNNVSSAPSFVRTSGIGVHGIIKETQMKMQSEESSPGYLARETQTSFRRTTIASMFPKVCRFVDYLFLLYFVFRALVHLCAFAVAPTPAPRPCAQDCR